MMRKGMQAEGFKTQKEIIQFIFPHFQTILLDWNESAAGKHEGLAASLPKAGLRLWFEAQLIDVLDMISLKQRTQNALKLWRHTEENVELCRH